ncbi:MAG: AMP-binding protein [Clostridiales bacterium]|nr:AMP-binding protein [Clostridiales bacterium]
MENQNSYQEYVERLNRRFTENEDREEITYIRNNGQMYSTCGREVREKIGEITEEIVKAGGTGGDRIAVIAPVTPNTVFVCLALAYAHMTAVMIDVSLPDTEINRILENADVRGIFTIGRQLSLLEEKVRKTIPIFDVGEGRKTLSLFPQSVSKVRKAETIDKDPDVIAILYSSGTTSAMKGVMVTYKSILLSADILKKDFGIRNGMKYLNVLPITHIAGYDSMMFFLLNGCKMGLLEEVNATKMQQGLRIYNPHYFGMVPKVYDLIAEKMQKAIREKGILAEHMVNGLLRISGYLRKRFGIKAGKILFRGIYRQVFGNEIFGLSVMGTVCKKETAQFYLNMGLEWANMYASTETNAPIACTGIYDRYPLNSAGDITRHTEITVRIQNPDKEGIGEVQVKSELIMKGYFREKKLTEEAFEDGYFKTGDLGYVDDKNQLYITGRIKEAIILHNGEKVSPEDIDAFYGNVCEGIGIAACGMPTEDGYDAVHLFVEKGNLSEDEWTECRKRLLKKSLENYSIYKIEEIHLIDKIPMTTVGKIKRYRLKEMVREKEDTKNIVADEALPEEAAVLQILQKLAGNSNGEISLSMLLREELGLDSLTLFELCVALEEQLGIDIAEYLPNIRSGEDILQILENKNDKGDEKLEENRGYNVEEFPLKKTKADVELIKKFGKISSFLWDFKVIHGERMDTGKKYLLCPNHESYFDALWVAASLAAEGRRVDHFCCMAAQHLMENRWMKKAFVALGGIPVDRTGNAVPATERALAYVRQNDCLMLIHPEGTRSRSGKMGAFKQGAAKIAIEAGIEIIPVCIEGAYKIFPPHKKVPRIMNRKTFKKYPLHIIYGQPIVPQGKTAEQLTEEIKEQIISMKKEGIRKDENRSGC